MKLSTFFFAVVGCLLSLLLVGSVFAANVTQASDGAGYFAQAIRSSIDLNATAQAVGQSFNITGTNYNIQSIGVKLNETSADTTSIIRLQVYAANSTQGPNGSVLEYSNIVSSNSVPTGVPTWVNFTFNSTANYTSGTEYVFAITSNSTGGLFWGYATGDVYTGGIGEWKSAGGMVWGILAAGADGTFNITYTAADNNFSLTATDTYDGSTINTFNLTATSTYNGTLYNLSAPFTDDFESYEANYYLERNSYIPQRNNLVAYYSYQGCEFVNMVNGTAGVMVNSPTCQRGIIGNNSYSLNGSQYMTIPVMFNSSVTNYTVCAEINVASTLTDSQYVIGRLYGSSASARSGSLYVDSAMQLRSVIVNGSSTSFTNPVGLTVAVNSPSLVCGYFNTTHVYASLNAVFSTAQAVVGPSINSTSTTNIGVMDAGSGTPRYFNGTIDEVMVWRNTTLSTIETASLYARTNTTYFAPVNGSNWNVTAGIVSVGQYFNVSGVGNRGLMCGLGGGVCQLNRSWSFVNTPSVSVTTVTGSANISYSNGYIYLNISDGGTVDNVLAYDPSTPLHDNSDLYCPAYRQNSNQALLGCFYNNQTATFYNATDGLVAYYPFDTGWFVNDTTRANNGTSINTTVEGGIIGTGAYSFNGVSSSITTIPSTSLNSSMTEGTWTVWIVPKTQYENKQIVTKTFAYRFLYSFAAQRIQFQYGTSTDAWATTFDSGRNLVTNVPNFLTVTYNSSLAINNMIFYINGEQVAVKNATGAINGSANTYLIIGGDGTTSVTQRFFNGTIDEVRIYNRSLSAQEVFNLYRYGSPGFSLNSSVTSYNYTLFNASMQAANVSTSSNTFVWNNSIRGNFNLFFSTTTGLINQFLETNVLWDLLVQSPNYFNYTATSYNVSNDLNAAMLQSIVGFTATEIITGNPVSTFTITAGLATNSTSGLDTLLYLKAGSYNATFNKTGWYNKTESITATALTTSNETIEVYASVLNITAISATNGTNITNFSVNVTSGVYNYTTTASTTNGTVLLPWVNDTNINITFSANGYATSYNSTSISTAGYTNVTIYAFTSESIRFRFYDEQTGNLIVNNTVTAYLTSSIASYNFTTNNGTYYIDLLTPATYTITYSGQNYSQREYFYTVTEDSTAALDLFLLNETEDTIVLVNVFDSKAARVPDAVVKMQKKNLSGTNYYIVEMCRTNVLGQCLLRVDLYDTTYRFLIEYEDEVKLNSNDTKIDRTELSFTINLQANLLTTFYELNSLQYNLTMNTTHFTLTWNDVYNNVQNACLQVQKRTGAYFTNENTSCTSSASGTIVLPYYNATGDEWLGVGYVMLEDGSRLILGSISNVTSRFKAQFGTNGLFLFGFLVLGTMAFAYLFHPIVSIVVMGAGTFALNGLGFISIGTSAVMSLVIIIIAFLFMLKRT